MVQEGLLALSKSIDTYNPSKGKFSNYASRCIKNVLINYSITQTRKKNKSVSTISTEKPIESKSRSGFEYQLKDVLYSKNENIEEKICSDELSLEIRRLISMLPERRRKIIKLYYGFIGNSTYTFRSLAPLFGISRAVINNELRSGEKFLKGKLVRLGLIEVRESDREKVESYTSNSKTFQSVFTNKK